MLTCRYCRGPLGGGRTLSLKNAVCVALAAEILMVWLFMPFLGFGKERLGSMPSGVQLLVDDFLNGFAYIGKVSGTFQYWVGLGVLVGTVMYLACLLWKRGIAARITAALTAALLIIFLLVFLERSSNTPEFYTEHNDTLGVGYYVVLIHFIALICLTETQKNGFVRKKLPEKDGIEREKNNV